MTLQLRDVQELAVREMIQAIEGGERDILWEAGTGVGKTITAIEFLNRQLTGRALIVGHYGELLDQWDEALGKYGTTGKSIGLVQGMHSESGADIVLGTVQTLSKFNRFKDVYLHGDIQFLIIDEAHRSKAKTYEDVIAWSKSCDDLVIIRLTATPDRTDGQVVDGHRLTPVDQHVATELGYLAPHQVITYEVEVEEAIEVDQWGDGEETIRGDYKLGNDIMNEPEVNQNVFDEWKKVARHMKTIGFTASVNHAMAMADTFNVNGITATYVSYNAGQAHNDAAVAGFRDGTYQVIFNVNKFTEGFDEADTECLIMLRPTQSELVSIQIYGRVKRVADGKAEGLILQFIPANREVMTTDYALRDKAARWEWHISDGTPNPNL